MLNGVSTGLSRVKKLHMMIHSPRAFQRPFISSHYCLKGGRRTYLYETNRLVDANVIIAVGCVREGTSSCKETCRLVYYDTFISFVSPPIGELGEIAG